MGYVQKLFALGKLQLKTSFVYRLKFLSSIIISPLTLIIYYFIWNAVYQNTEGSIFGYTFPEMVTYLVISMIIGHAIYNMVGPKLQQKIIYGNLSQDLLKPISVFAQYLSSDVSERMFAIVMEVIPIFILSIFLFNIKTRLVYFILFVFSLVFAFLINFLLSFLMGILAFWINKIESIQWLMFMGIRFLSGEFIPLNFFGETFFKISQFLPFYYIRYGVINLYLGKHGLIGSIVFILKQLIWVIVLYLLVKFLWKLAMKRFGAVGG